MGGGSEKVDCEEVNCEEACGKEVLATQQRAWTCQVRATTTLWKHTPNSTCTAHQPSGSTHPQQHSACARHTTTTSASTPPTANMSLSMVAQMPPRRPGGQT
eukprot:364337-Chlamydomonas_euryale.AAC.12